MEHFQSASELVRAVNAYLDSIEGTPPKDADEARERLRRLMFFRDEMDAFHFKNPRFAVVGLMRALYKALRTMDKSEVREVMPELHLLRYTYELRRITYDRARAAYIANRAALRIYETNVFKDLLDYLPYGGEYLEIVERFGSSALVAYRDVLETLGVRDPRVEIDLEGEAEEIGPRSGIFGDRVATEVLLSTLLAKGLDNEWENILAEERREIKNYERMLEYERIVRKYPLRTIGERPDLLWKLLQELEEKGFLRDGDVDPDVINALRKRRVIRYRRVHSVLLTQLREFLRDYYLLLPERLRKNKPILPGIPPSPGSVLHLLGDDASIVQQKILLESAVSLPSALLGPAVLHVVRSIPLDELARTYNVDVQKLASAVETVRAAVSGNARVRKFLDAMRGGGSGQ